MIRKVEEEFPRGASWHHDRVDDNGDAHLASIFLGSSKLFIVKDGKPILGTWQSILFLELDGPRERRVVIETMGDL